MIAAMSDPATAAPPVAGFVESAFSPLVYQTVERCLTARPGDGSRTAIVLASTVGDATTLDLGSRLLVAGQVHNPLLFMQSTANAILGMLSREFAITGPLLCLSAATDLAGELLSTAELLLDDEDLDRVVLIGVELAATERTTAAYRHLRGIGPPATDLAVAIVLDRDDTPLPRPSYDAPSTEYGTLRGLAELAARIQGTNP